MPLVYLMVDARKDPAKMGLLNVCTFVLLRLSGQREFGVQLNQPLSLKIPTDLPAVLPPCCVVCSCAAAAHELLQLRRSSRWHGLWLLSCSN